MRVTIIPADHWIRRDGIEAVLPEWPFNDGTIHAIQWYDSQGEIEHRETPPRNEAITDPSVLEPYLAALDAYLQSTEQAELGSAQLQAILQQP